MESDNDRVRIGKVGFDRLNWAASVAAFDRLFDTPGQHQVATANAEFVVTAEIYPDVTDILNRASLILPDGMGILWAAQISQLKGLERFWVGLKLLFAAARNPALVQGLLPERISGVDHVVEECRMATRRGLGVFLLGASDEAREGAYEFLKTNVPGINIVGSAGGANPFDEADKLVEAVNITNAGFLIVCYGHPAQERWIAGQLPKMPSVKVAVGAGGTFDFMAGIQKRAPESWRRRGFEGIWRFLRNPLKRAKKAWVTYIVFVFGVLTGKI